MTADPARRYHDATKHTPERLRAALYRLDWENRPLPFKFYPDLRPVPLPRLLPETLPAEASLGGDAAVVPLDLTHLARLLFYTAGVTRPTRAMLFRAAPSAGALYPVEVYVVAGAVEGLEPGVYHFNPVDFALRSLRPGDLRHVVADAVSDPDPAGRAATLVFTGIPWRTTWKYRERGYRHLFWDAGTMLGNLLALDGSAGVQLGFADENISRLLDLGTFEEYPLVLAPVGPLAPEALGVVLDQTSPGHRVLALSRRSVEHPAVGEVHRAGTLDDPAAVADWRRRAAGLRPHSTLRRVEPPEGVSGSIEQVILRRGSSRRFRREAVRREAADFILSVALRPVPADFVASERSLLERLVAVHAVEGLPAGAYRATPEGLELIHSRASREITAHLCLDQPLGGDAAFTVLFATPLDQVLDALGPRGYRAAQLEAGIAAERLHLASYSLGLGCTGLTFYDDEIRRYFTTEAEPMLVAAVGRPAYRARTGRPPSEQPALQLVPADVSSNQG